MLCDPSKIPTLLPEPAIIFVSVCISVPLIGSLATLKVNVVALDSDPVEFIDVTDAT